MSARSTSYVASVAILAVATAWTSVASANNADSDGTATDADAQDSAQEHAPNAPTAATPAPAASSTPSSSFDDRWQASLIELPVAMAPPPAGVDAPSSDDVKNAAIDKKHAVVARDFGFDFPIGSFAGRAAPMYGPRVRVGYQLNEKIEVGVRAAYQRGFDRDIDGEPGSLSAIPINASFRYFAFGRRSGPYSAVEAGVNLFRLRTRARTSFWDVGADQTWARPCMNVAVGWVYSRTFPVDLRAQVASLDLISAGKGPFASMTVGMTAGYTIFF